eukprot:Seg2177.5 transcript_id=Seg2177.5/GoldUCD/mRNA.D3Y31 product=Internalin-I protein_id=Seg2177.5/GoldUCD/D3Y31
MDNLATLASMGFDIDECEAVLHIENMTLQEAIQRLLESRGNATSLNTSSTCLQNVTDVSEATKTCSEASDNHVKETLENHESVVSRLAMSDRQKELKEDFERKEIAEAQSAVKKRKVQDRAAKTLVLQEIEANKKRIRDLKCVKKPTTQHEPVQNETTVVSESLLSNESKEKLCRIQIRLPSAKSIVSQFPEQTLLSNVLAFACSSMEESTTEPDSPILMQPFPRREFNQEDLNESLNSLGLCPNASLVLIRRRHTNQQGSSHIIQKEDNQSQTSHDYDGASTNVHSVHFSQSNLQREWGRGARLTGKDELPVEPSELMDLPEEQRDRRVNINRSAFLRSVLENQAGSGECRETRDLSNQELSAASHNENQSSSSDSMGPHQRKIAMMEAIEKRANLLAANRELQPKKEHVSIKRDIQPLIEICANCVAKDLAAQHGPVLSFIGKTLSQQAATQVIHALKNRKLLTGKLLQLFHPCKLSQLNLNCYHLTSNEILEAARLHVTLTCLTLSQCALITDIGVIIAVRGLKHLQVLDLSGCVQVTDKALSEIKELQQLRSLKLDNTKIKDGGLRDFLCHKDRTSLLELSANATGITANAFPTIDSGITFNVTALCLDRTKVASLEFLCCFPFLRHLSLSGAPIISETVQCLQQTRKLEDLNLSHTSISNDSLQHIAGLPIRSLCLPDRLNITDAALKFIEGLPLTNLNLADYIHITDVGLASVGKITSLNSLSLANTKISDDGLRNLQGLCQLQELDLAKAPISDDGVRLITGLKSIHTLSLASTRITNKIFEDGTMNLFCNLFKLNVSRNKISDAGLCHLHLGFLEMINADQTYTSPAAFATIEGCPRLKVLRAQNCRLAAELEDMQ